MMNRNNPDVHQRIPHDDDVRVAMADRSESSPEGSATAIGVDRRRKIIAGSVGNMVEFLDWCIFATFSSIFAHQFFPAGNDAAALLSTLAIFAVGFTIRPVGAAVLGSYADKHGRKKSLVLTVALMSGATLVIGLAPSYSKIGFLAPVILVVARLVQGFAAGGEFGIASAFLVESASPRRRAFAGSFQQVSVGAGLLIASALGAVLTSALSKDALDSWGWRLGFVVASGFGVVALWVRRSVDENDSFHRGEERRGNSGERRSAFVQMVRDHPGSILRVFSINIAGMVLYNIFVTYLPTYAHVTTGMSLSSALTANTIGMLLFIVLLPFAGLASDRFGRRATMALFAGGFVVFSWPALKLLDGGFWSYLVIQIVALILMLGYSANLAAIMAEQFPPEVRATGIGMPYSICVALFGGTAPYLMTWMYEKGISDWLWVYCTAAAVFGLVVYLTMPETRGKPLD
ncbi:MFS transporter [Rhodococcus sp. T2V]|uniref:MFS transporter n=1 Tax=Rhodococcus sp. T2V TaxID=3034164 RepID=UPI0023E29683|nr:MFS transporter [Rhodococcus sp. T2V]MDF3309633.1 MFS transporter [Rhodococcus sp. T2V]